MSEPRKPAAEEADKPSRPVDRDSAGTYFMSIEEFEGRPITRKDGVRVVEAPEEDSGEES